MQNQEVERRYSSEFWMTKIGWLIGLLLVGLAIIWVWQWDAKDDDSDNSASNAVQAVDTDNDGLTDDIDDDDDDDGYTDVEERTAGSDSLSASSVPTTDIDSGATSDQNNSSSSDAPISISLPSDFSELRAVIACAYETEAAGPQGSGKTVITVAYDCATDNFTKDFMWTAQENSNGSFSVTDSPVAYCVRAGDPSCSSGNGILEVLTLASGLDGSQGLMVNIVDDTGINETNAVEVLVPIIESIKVNK